MKTKSLFWLIPLLLLSLTACEETPPTFNRTIPDGVPKKVLIEKFTGVKCVNCPAASVEIEGIIDAEGESLVKAVSIHTGNFAIPSDEYSTQDFRTTKGESLVTFLGQPAFYPIGIVGRKEKDNSIFQPRNSWQSSVGEILSESADVSMSMTAEVDKITRELNVNFLGTFLADIDFPVRYTVMLTESGVIEPQETPDGWDMEYEHKHLLRDIMTSASGQNLADNPVKEQTFSKALPTYTIPEEWVIEELEVIVIIHGGASNKEALQVESVKLD